MLMISIKRGVEFMRIITMMIKENVNLTGIHESIKTGGGSRTV